MFGPGIEQTGAILKPSWLTVKWQFFWKRLGVNLLIWMGGNVSTSDSQLFAKWKRQWKKGNQKLQGIKYEHTHPGLPPPLPPRLGGPPNNMTTNNQTNYFTEKSEQYGTYNRRQYNTDSIFISSMWKLFLDSNFQGFQNLPFTLN